MGTLHNSGRFRLPPVARSAGAAFTLVELLVVIGIIALLISILLPVLGKAKEAANSAKCLSNMRQAGMAVVFYTNEYRGKFLPPYRVPERTPNYVPQGAGGNWNGAPYFFTWLSGRYLREAPGMWVCPTDRFVETVAKQMRLYSNVRDSTTSYLMNRDMPGYRLPIYPPPYDHVYFAPRPLRYVKSTTRLIIYAESASGFGLASFRSAAPAGQPQPLRFDHRNKRAMSVGFADGHAEQLGPDEIMLRAGETITPAASTPIRIREYWYGHPTYERWVLVD